MVKIVVEDGTCIHNGTTVVGPVAGTLTTGSNTFAKINGKLIMVEDGTLEVPLHKYQNSPALFHSHSFSVNSFQQSFAKINGKRIILLGDNYSNDITTINNQGSNTFCDINNF